MRDKRILCDRPMYVLERGYRYHWVEGGFRVNMEFIKWKLKYYWHSISRLWSFEYDYWWELPLMPIIYPLYLVALALQLCYMPFDIVKTVFITHAIKDQEQYFYEYKLRNFGIHDPRNAYDLSTDENFINWKKTHKYGEFGRTDTGK